MIDHKFNYCIRGDRLCIARFIIARFLILRIISPILTQFLAENLCLSLLIPLILRLSNFRPNF